MFIVIFSSQINFAVTTSSKKVYKNFKIEKRYSKTKANKIILANRKKLTPIGSMRLASPASSYIFEMQVKTNNPSVPVLRGGRQSLPAVYGYACPARQDPPQLDFHPR